MAISGEWLAPDPYSHAGAHYGRPKSATSISSLGSVRLIRGPEVEPRSAVWVYDYHENTRQKMKVSELFRKYGGRDQIVQIAIPKRPGTILIRADTDELHGPNPVVARVRIGVRLRILRWLGLQKNRTWLTASPSEPSIMKAS